jgi:phosphoglycolate phosphatase
VTELLVVGDTPSDVEFGLRAGAGVVAGVTTGASGADELAAAGAPYVLDSVTALVQLLGIGAAAPR